MGLAALLVIIALLAGGWLLLRRSKRREPTNRYRNYQARAVKSPKQPKMRRNRYHRAARREPDLEAKDSEEMIEIIEQVKAPKPQKAVQFNVENTESDDPDVVLGLKEPPRFISEDRKKPIPNEAQITLKPPPPPPPIITFYVMAEEEKPFSGYELLQAILSIGARFGEHQIFHRHQEKTGHGPVLFSIASAVKPGTFDLSKMGGFSTPGLSLFFCVGDVEDPVTVYELMLQTAGQLVEDLGGHVLDEYRQLLTPTKVVTQRHKLREYLQGQQIPDLFEETVE